jgi:hypothetical protein
MSIFEILTLIISTIELLMTIFIYLNSKDEKSSEDKSNKKPR